MKMNRILRTLLMVTLSMALAVGMWGVMPAQRVAAATCTSTGSGNWSNSATWSGCDDGVPGAGDDIIIQAGHTVTVDVNATVNNIMLQGASSGTRLTLNNGITLVVNGTLNSDNSPGVNIISGNGLLKFAGGTRALFGENWGASPRNWNLEIALESNATGTSSGRNIKAGTIVISSGTFEGVDVHADQGAENSGSLTVAEGATLSATNIQRTGTSNTAIVTNNGTIEIRGTGQIKTNSLINNGTLKQTQNVNGSTDVNLFNTGGYGGLTINASGSDLGSTVVSIKGNQACDTDNTAVKRCFDIAPTNATGRNATITFYYDSAELNSLDCTTMNAWHWSGALPWVQAGTSGTRQCTTDPYSLQVTGVTTFSPFALRSGAAGPTSVGFVALGGSASLLPIGMLLLAGLVVLRKRK